MEVFSLMFSTQQASTCHFLQTDADPVLHACCNLFLECGISDFVKGLEPRSAQSTTSCKCRSTRMWDSPHFRMTDGLIHGAS